MISRMLRWLRRNRLQDEVGELQRQLTALSNVPTEVRHERDSGDEVLYRALCENFESSYLALFRLQGQSQLRRQAATAKVMTRKAGQ